MLLITFYMTWLTPFFSTYVRVWSWAPQQIWKTYNNAQVYIFISIGRFAGDYHMRSIGITRLYAGIVAMGLGIVSHHRMCERYIDWCIGVHTDRFICRTLLCHCKSITKTSGKLYKRFSLNFVRLHFTPWSTPTNKHWQTEIVTRFLCSGCECSFSF